MLRARTTPCPVPVPEEYVLSAHRTVASRLRAAVLGVTVVTAVAVIGPGAPARAEPTQPEVAPTAGAETSLPEAPTELAEAPAEEAPSDDGQETVAAVVVEDGQPTVVTVEAAPTEVAEVQEELAEQPGVVDVFVDAPARAATLPNDPRVEDQWNLYELHVAQQGISWATATAGSGELVAVLDTGVDDAHPDLLGRVRCDLGADFTVIPEDGPIVSTDDGCADPVGHGTHVAGIVGAQWNNGEGVAGISRAQILPVRVLDDDGFGSIAGISAGIIHAVDAGARVINLSIVSEGLPGASGYEEAVQYALDNDVVVVASAGNNRQEGNRPQYPAAVPGVFSVAATDDLQLSAAFSYQGSTNFISAPGTDILSTVPGGYRSYSGTSMAAPHVAGIIAWYRERNGAATVDQIRTAVETTAIDMERPGKDNSTGWGMIDMAELLTGSQQANEYWYRNTLPAAPVITSASPRDSALRVTWRPPAWNGGAPIRRYGVHVWRYVYGEYEYVDFAEAANTATSLTVPGLVNGRTYVAVAYARTDDLSDGQYSVDSLPVRIIVPRIGTPTAGPGAARVTWTGASSVDGLPVAKYRVQAYVGSTRVKSLDVSAATREVRFSGLTNGRAHTFLVWALNAQGTSVPSKRSVAVTPRAKPGAPRIGRPAAADNAARVYWAAPADNGGAAISGYVIKVYQGTRGIKSVTVPGGSRSVLVTGLKHRQWYSFTVTAKNVVGLGPASPRSAGVRTR